MDDILTTLRDVKIGTFWDNSTKSLQWSQERHETDNKENLNPDKRTMQIIAEMGSSILDCLDFTYDTPSQNSNL